MSDPTGALFEGILETAPRFYELRSGINERKRRQALEDEEMAYLRAERERRLRQGAREEAAQAAETGLDFVPSRVPRNAFTPPTFGPEPVSRDDLLRFRGDVGRGLRGDRSVDPGFTAPRLGPQRDIDPGFTGPPSARFPGDPGIDPGFTAPRPRGRIEFGGLEETRTPRAVTEELSYDPRVSTGSLQGDLARARQPSMNEQVGRALGGFAGREDLTPTQAGLVGRGAIPPSMLTPRRWEPRTREEQLDFEHDRARATGLLGQRERSGPTARRREDLAAVERQLDDVRAELAAAQRAIPPAPPLAEFDEGIARAHVERTAPGRRRVAALQQRLDSLNRVRDRLASERQDGVPFDDVKTPGQWVDEVASEHPDWTAEQVAAEARRRAGQLP